MGRAVWVKKPSCNKLGSSRKMCKEFVEEDLATLSTEEAEVIDRDRWKHITDWSTS